MTDLATLKTRYLTRRFGLFLHFNMSTFKNIEWANPAESPNSFNPGATLDVAQWLDTARLMKAQYACLTAKHHDGFCLWPTATTSHNITSSSWYSANGSRNILQEYVDQCASHLITPLIYFSIWDKKFELDNPSFTQAQYRTYLEAQITELLTGYGSIAGLWLDGTLWHFGGGISPLYPWDSFAQFASFVRGLQTDCLIINNSHLGNAGDTDIVVYEGGTVGSAVPSNNATPAEYADTIRQDDNWFWKPAASSPVAASTLLATLTTVNSRAASFLLNAGPDNTGVIPSDEVTELTTVGQSVFTSASARMRLRCR